MKVFGRAADFYRLRVLKVNEDSDVDLRWRKDILYRQQHSTPMTTRVRYVVQAVTVDSEDCYSLKEFPTGEAAMRFKDRVEDVLRETTKHEFEERFPVLRSEA